MGLAASLLRAALGGAAVARCCAVTAKPACDGSVACLALLCRAWWQRWSSCCPQFTRQVACPVAPHCSHEGDSLLCHVHGSRWRQQRLFFGPSPCLLLPAGRRAASAAPRPAAMLLPWRPPNGRVQLHLCSLLCRCAHSVELTVWCSMAPFARCCRSCPEHFRLRAMPFYHRSLVCCRLRARSAACGKRPSPGACVQPAAREGNQGVCLKLRRTG